MPEDSASTPPRGAPSEARAGEVALAAYADRLSARPGDRVEYKVSATRSGRPVRATLWRSICADADPSGPGLIERPAERWFEPLAFEAVHRPFRPGSHAVAPVGPTLDGERMIALEATVFPTLPGGREGCVLAAGGARLSIAPDGRPAATLGTARALGRTALAARRWVRLRASFDIVSGTARVEVLPTGDGVEGDAGGGPGAGEGEGDRGGAPAARASPELALPPSAAVDRTAVGIAARLADGVATDHFDGRIESPAILAGAREGALSLRARWDFALGIPTMVATDVGPGAHHARLVNAPVRAVRGSCWDGTEMCWRHAPAHYAAIHFHHDAIVDFGWDTDFAFELPDDIPSGVYVMRLAAEAHGGAPPTEDAVPLFVCPPAGRRTNDLCVLVPTFTYTVYGNHARPDWEPSWREVAAARGAWPVNPAEHRDYGLSTYNDHADGSGICHASHRRPLFNLRPGYRTFGEQPGSAVRHFQADSHLFAWLDAKGIGVDVLTDRELHDSAGACLEGYRAVATTTHPEYHTATMLDGLARYRDTGGRLLYLGGNGFYWRVALHGTEPDLIEIRRAEDGIRAWAAEPGEYWQAFDGAYGGLWRRNGRPPQALVGVGFSAQGSFEGSRYRRRTTDPAFDWVFEGIEGDTFGDHGLCGGGAAGFELDRADAALGTPEQAVTLASSEGHGPGFVLVPEEVLTHLTTLPGEPAESLLRADMLWMDVPGGGAVFSVGSITFCGSLPTNGFDNDVSTLLGNVLGRMLGDARPG